MFIFITIILLLARFKSIIAWFIHLWHYSHYCQTQPRTPDPRFRTQPPAPRIRHKGPSTQHPSKGQGRARESQREIKHNVLRACAFEKGHGPKRSMQACIRYTVCQFPARKSQSFFRGCFLHGAEHQRPCCEARFTDERIDPEERLSQVYCK